MIKRIINLTKLKHLCNIIILVINNFLNLQNFIVIHVNYQFYFHKNHFFIEKFHENAFLIIITNALEELLYLKSNYFRIISKFILFISYLFYEYCY